MIYLNPVAAEHIKEERTIGLETLKKNKLSPLHLNVVLVSSFLEQIIYFLLSEKECSVTGVFFIGLGGNIIFHVGQI